MVLVAGDEAMTATIAALATVWLVTTVGCLLDGYVRSVRSGLRRPYADVLNQHVGDMTFLLLAVERLRADDNKETL
jgi:hypothetical protein